MKSQYILSFLLSILTFSVQAKDLPGGKREGDFLPSYTLPIVHINTKDSLPIDQKETYIEAQCWIENFGEEVFDNIGSKDEPVTLGIRGRGNSSWFGYDKKSYKVKFDKKQPVLGMPKSKHWVLRTHLGGYLSYFPDQLAKMVADKVGMAWTPAQQPVELFLNGKYIGLYFLGESVRIESNRVNIFEQPDLNEDPNTIQGGYLVELDNYEEENQIVLTEPDYNIERFRLHTPEAMSDLQRTFMTTQLQGIIDAIYCPDKTSRDWEKYLDPEALAKYIVVNEAVNNYEAFVGSCYFYKDTVEGARWMMGPLWDVATGFGNPKTTFAFQAIDYHSAWIDQLIQFPRLMKWLQAVTHSLQEQGWDDLYQGARDYGQRIKAAEQKDRVIWPYLKGQPDMRFQGKGASRQIVANLQWLVDELGKPQYTVYSAIPRVSNLGNALISISSHVDTVAAFEGMRLTLKADSLRIPNQVKYASFDGVDITAALNEGSVEVEMPAHDAVFEVELLDLSEITTVEGNSNTKPRFFNLQGIEIPEAPASGFYLRQCGSKVTKLRAAF